LAAQNEERVAEFMRPVRMHFGLFDGSANDRVVLEGAEEFVMARPGFMLSGNQCVDDPQARERTDLQRRDRPAASNAAVVRRRVFERSNHGRSDGNDAPAPSTRRVDGICRSHGNLVRLGEREHCVETRVASRGNPGSMSQRRECRASRAKAADEPPIEEKTADGASKATGRLAILVHVSHNASGAERYEY
jgi:hypothetical protein